MDIRAYNRAAWDRQVETQNPWTIPVAPDVIARARQGDWHIVLTENKPIPREWFPASLAGLPVLCLASGGGQQGPVLAAAGAVVTVYDNSPRQLAQDRLVAERDGLTITLVEGDMRDLSVFADESFDLIVHPVSNLFIPDVRPVWREAYRILRPGGALLAGFNNPAFYLFDFNAADRGVLVPKYRLPYSDLEHLSPEDLASVTERGLPLEWSHSLTDQIGGQLDAGFRLAGLYEDHNNYNVIGTYMPTYVATRAIKPRMKDEG